MFISEIVVATDIVWSDISSYLNGLMSKSAIHTFVYKGRHGIKEKLGFCFCPKIDPPEAIFNSSIKYGQYCFLHVLFKYITYVYTFI